MKKSEFLKIKESTPDSRIGRRSWKEQDTRDDLAFVLKKQRRREKTWCGRSTLLIKMENKLKSKKLNFEIERASHSIDTDKFTEFDLKFLESLSYENLSKIPSYQIHWMRKIVHTASDVGVPTSWDYPYFPKYTFLYEICKDKTLISEETKIQLKEKAKDEVWKMVCDEIKADTVFYDKSKSFVKHVSEYIPQKVFANKLRWTWNMWCDTYVDALWRHIDWFTDLDEDYKKEIRREYNNSRGIIDPEDIEEKKEESEESTEEEYEKTWDEALDAYMESGRKDAKAFVSFMEKLEKDKRRFDDWLEKEWWL